MVVVRGERRNLLAEVGHDAGALSKPFFVRSSDPYGLIDAAALFEWVVHREELAFRTVSEASVNGVSGAVVVHRVGRFERLSNPVPDAALEASHWRASGLPLRLIQAVSLD